MAKEIPLTKGKAAIVDDADFEWLSQYRWCFHKTGYATRCTSSGVTIYMHREILAPPQGYFVDHRDGDRLNNQRSNLRICTKLENTFNKNISASRASSIYKGVTLYRENANPWRARITFGGKIISLGLFATEIEAAIAYNEAAIKYHGEFARLNELPSD